MLSDKRVQATEIVKDILAGMNAAALRSNYCLSSKTLHKILQRLVDAKIVTEEFLATTTFESDQIPWKAEHRGRGRCYPIPRLPIIDLEDLSSDFYVRDFTDEGFQIVGVNAAVGQTKTFLIQAGEFADVEPFSFDGICRWVRTEGTKRISGFAVVNITQADLAALRKLIGLVAFCDEGVVSPSPFPSSKEGNATTA
jgi:hypothetical protein